MATRLQRQVLPHVGRRKRPPLIVTPQSSDRTHQMAKTATTMNHSQKNARHRAAKRLQHSKAENPVRTGLTPSSTAGPQCTGKRVGVTRRTVNSTSTKHSHQKLRLPRGSVEGRAWQLPHTTTVGSVNTASGVTSVRRDITAQQHGPKGSLMGGHGIMEKAAPDSGRCSTLL